MTTVNPDGQPEIFPLLAEMSRNLRVYRDNPGGLAAGVAAEAYIEAAEGLRKALSVRAYPADPEHDKSEQIVVTAFGVDFLIRHRGGDDNDLFVHIDSTERRVTGVPFVVAVNEGGENVYGDGREKPADEE